KPAHTFELTGLALESQTFARGRLDGLEGELSNKSRSQCQRPPEHIRADWKPSTRWPAPVISSGRQVSFGRLRTFFAEGLRGYVPKPAVSRCSKNPFTRSPHWRAQAQFVARLCRVPWRWSG